MKFQRTATVKHAGAVLTYWSSSTPAKAAANPVQRLRAAARSLKTKS